MNRADKNKGFTLIELMLAMAFLSVLLISIALLLIQIGTIYNKGMVTKEINQTGRAVSDDFRRVAGAAESITLDTDYVATTGGGRLCLGTYSYIWNTAKALKNNDVNLTTYSTTPTKQIRLVKVVDKVKLYCAKTTSGALTYKQIQPTDEPAARELLPTGDHLLNLTQLGLLPAATVSDSTTGETLYTLQYTIGTGEIEAMNADQSACLPPDNINSDLTYCTVQQFSLVLRTGNKVN